ncbi:hypothetical protein H8356DRAFT_1639883 [Neocallimastix lanati (nom. inval.)]|nr:hypothetical protein H8356DRAFT_1639883 [Neocallimastix sp. JGI-2020a]
MIFFYIKIYLNIILQIITYIFYYYYFYIFFMIISYKYLNFSLFFFLLNKFIISIYKKYYIKYFS